MALIEKEFPVKSLELYKQVIPQQPEGGIPQMPIFQVVSVATLGFEYEV
jgi:hypothetical protein